jgi:hypothetical protein
METDPHKLNFRRCRAHTRYRKAGGHHGARCHAATHQQDCGACFRSSVHCCSSHDNQGMEIIFCSELRIRCLFDPCIREGKKSGIRIGNEQHGSYFRELRNNLILIMKHIFTILKLLNFIHSLINIYKIDFFLHPKSHGKYLYGSASGSVPKCHGARTLVLPAYTFPITDATAFISVFISLLTSTVVRLGTLRSGHFCLIC